MKAVLLVVLALAAAAHAQPTCQRLTGKAGCSECRRNVCLYCGKGWGEVWAGAGANLQVSKCNKAAPTCAAATGDANCAACVGSTCIECKTTNFPVRYTLPANAGGVKTTTFQRHSRYLSWVAGANFGKCVAPTGASAQNTVTGNLDCLEFNPDGSCSLCKNWNVLGQNTALVLPNNAVWTNGVYPMSSCRRRFELRQFSLQAVGRDMTLTNFIPDGCVEVGTDYKCQRCKPNSALATTATGARCVVPSKPQVDAKKNANGCINTLPYQHYCEKCNPVGNFCMKCVPGRSAVNGFCSLPCKQLFGITCLTCNANACLSNDPSFPNGRR